MKFSKYFTDLLRLTFRPAFERADIVSTIIGVIGGALVYFFPNVNQYIGIGLWLVPLLVFISIFLTRSLLAPYWLYKQLYEHQLLLESQLNAIKKPLPKVSYSHFRVAQLYRPSPVTTASFPIYEVLQAWFKNAPDFSSEESIGKDVSAVIEFWTSLQGKLLFQIHGQWAETTAPDHVGYKETKSIIDISPSHIAAKLMIALKYKDDDFAYPFSVESVRDFYDGRNPNFILKPGTYFLRIHLRGIGINKEFLFTLENFGSGKSLELKKA